MFVKALKTGGDRELRRFALLAFILFAIASAFYWVLLILFRQEVMTWLYGGRYVEHANLLILVGLLPLSAGGVAVLGGALRAMERPDQVFWCYVVSSFVALTLGLLLLATKGVTGAVWALLASSVATMLTMAWFYASHLRQIKQGV